MGGCRRGGGESEELRTAGGDARTGTAERPGQPRPRALLIPSRSASFRPRECVFAFPRDPYLVEIISGHYLRLNNYLSLMKTSVGHLGVCCGAG